MKNIKTTSILCLLVLLQSCSSYLQDSLNVSKTKKKYDKILVVARTQNDLARINFENKVVQYLSESGVNAISSKNLPLTKVIKDNINKEEAEKIRKQLVTEGFDGVIVTNLITSEQYVEVVEGNPSIYYGGYYGRFGGYYGYYPSTYWEPDRMETGVRYIFESNLYDVRLSESDNLEWIGRFKIDNPNNIKSTSDKYAKELVKTLLKESIQEE